MKPLASAILAAGDGTRLRSERPKALHEVCGHPMLHHILKVAALAQASKHVVVVGYEGHQIVEAFSGRPDVEFVHQEERLGTGHAMMMTRSHFEDFDGDLLVLAADTPLLTDKTLRKLVDWHRHQEAAATILTAEMENPAGYGRILRFEDNRVQGIVEDKDANRYERAIREINTGTYCFDVRLLFDALGKIKQDNVQNEYYLTDCVRILADSGKRVEALLMDDPDEAIGVNTRVQLAQAETVLRQRILERHMLEGITVIDPLTCYVDDEVAIGKDTILFPGTTVTGASKIGKGCRIGPNSQVHDAVVEDGAVVNASYVKGGTVAKGTILGPFEKLCDGAAQ